MRNKTSKLSIGIAILFEIILIITIIINLISKQRKYIFLSILAMLCITIPFIITYIANKKKILLPSNFQLVSLIFLLLAQYFGEILKFYRTFPWWDLLLHGIFGSYGVITALHLIQGVITKEKETTNQRFIFFTIIFAFCFSITLGTMWEMFEFVGDFLFKAKMVKGGLVDTATDILIKIASAFITSIIYYYSKI